MYIKLSYPTHLKVILGAAGASNAMPLPSRASTAIIALFEHIIGRCVQHPITSFAGCIVIINCIFITWHLDETIIQREVMPYGILPSLFVFPVVWESDKKSNEEIL